MTKSSHPDPEIRRRASRMRSMIMASEASLLREHDPQNRELVGKKVCAHDFIGGHVEYAPGATVLADTEIEIVHKLGRVPTGMIVVCGTTHLEWYSSLSQQARWTRSKIFIASANQIAADETFRLQVY